MIASTTHGGEVGVEKNTPVAFVVFKDFRTVILGVCFKHYITAVVFGEWSGSHMLLQSVTYKV